MDPDANIAMQSELIKQGRHKTREYFDLVDGLRQWLQRSGFQPDWAKYPDVAKRWGR